MSDLRWAPTNVGYPAFDDKGNSQEVLIQTKRGENFIAYCHKYKHWKTNEYIYEWYSYGTGGRRMKVMSSVIAWADFNRYGDCKDESK